MSRGLRLHMPKIVLALALMIAGLAFYFLSYQGKI